jgi:hypothetical protein
VVLFELLSDFVNSELQATNFLRKSALKDIAYNISLACWEMHLAGTENWWIKKYVGIDDVIQCHNISRIFGTICETACNGLRSNL